MSGELVVPHPLWEERSLAGCVVASRRGAALARDRVATSDFYELRLQRIYEHAISIDHVVEEAARVGAVAAATSVPEPDLWHLVEERPCFADTSGGLARRVRDAAVRREVMRRAASIFNQIGAGAALAEVADDIRNLERLLAS